VAGATIRVYINIGMFSEYWLTRHNRLIGLVDQQPFEISYAREHSVFWRATEDRLENIRAFFKKLKSFRLADAPGGAANISTDEAVMNRGKQVFANSCAYCHSSKQPPPGIDPESGDGKAWFRNAVMQPDFLEDNFLSNEKRYPLAKIRTNSRPRAWDQCHARSYLG
jgi:cytochrome c5